MKTKTIIRVLSVFFTLTLFFTSCTTEEVAIEEVENIIIETSNNNTANRAGDPVTIPTNLIYLEVEYYEDTTNHEKWIIRNKYENLIGTFSYIAFEKVDIWTIDGDLWDDYELTYGTSPDDDVDNEVEVKGAIIFSY